MKLYACVVGAAFDHQAHIDAAHALGVSTAVGMLNATERKDARWDDPQEWLFLRERIALAAARRTGDDLWLINDEPGKHAVGSWGAHADQFREGVIDWRVYARRTVLYSELRRDFPAAPPVGFWRSPEHRVGDPAERAAMNAALLPWYRAHGVAATAHRMGTTRQTPAFIGREIMEAGAFASASGLDWWPVVDAVDNYGEPIPEADWRIPVAAMRAAGASRVVVWLEAGYPRSIDGLAAFVAAVREQS